jgi:hypothetical protein
MKICSLLIPALFSLSLHPQARAADYYTAEKEYALQPDPKKGASLGQIGSTGITAYIGSGVKVGVSGTRKGSPADGKFQPNDIITGVNGNSLAGLNPYVALGQAITKAEATDGTLVFDVESAKGKRRETVRIPVMGAYGKNWPLDCPKSRKIVENAARHYADLLGSKADRTVGGALACLFLLSTGDDQYLPLVKKNYQSYINDPKSIGDHTWYNGYNGIACAEYYLRTGDKAMLPVLQALCDDARDRQNFDAAWKHWGNDIRPRYTVGGLMNPASVPVLTTLILSKEAGVNVDEKTLTNCLRYFYRFASHGTVPYGDHRPEGGVIVNGKDAMLAAAMQAATGASSDTTLYQMARDSLAMNTLNTWPGLVQGHGDYGRGDGIWRGIASSYLMEKAPARFREVMDRITWWYDLSRSDDGSMGLAACEKWGSSPDSGGAGALLLFTSPRKTLRISGAPRSKHAVDFQLPERIWGREADLAFHKITPAEGYETFGKEEPMHRIIDQIGTSFSPAAVAKDPDIISVVQLQRLVRHECHIVRTQAAKALTIKGEIKVLEELLRHPDPRVRRAALDGILDWKTWTGGHDKQPLSADRYTPGMIESISAMINNPEEALYVIDGALFAMRHTPAENLKKHYETIHQWAGHDDWWLRQGAFFALRGMDKDPETFRKVVPEMVNMMIGENHTMPRNFMNGELSGALKKFGSSSEIGILLSKGFDQGVAETQVLEGRRRPEGAYNLMQSILKAINAAPEIAPALAESLVSRGISQMDSDSMLNLVSGKDGLLAILSKLKGTPRDELAKVLTQGYRPDIIRRLKAKGGKDLELIDTLIQLNETSGSDVGWITLGSSASTARPQWQYHSFHPTEKKDIMSKSSGRRFRKVQLAPGLDGWFKPGFNAKGWQTGPAPIGKGAHPLQGKNPPPIASPWGEGEILLARTTFEVTEKDLACDVYRLKVLSQQGFEIYLNGKKIQTYTWWQEPSEYRSWPFGTDAIKLLKKGQNTLAIYTTEMYPSAAKPHWKDPVYGKIDLRIEGLKVEELY